MSYYGAGSAGGLGVAGGRPSPEAMAAMSKPGQGADGVYELSKSYDRRMTPAKQQYVAPMGAASSTSVNVKLTQVNNQTHTFPITPPSPGVVFQGNVMYDLSSYVTFTSSHVADLPFGMSFPRYGVDFAIASSNPINRMVQNWQITINNQTVQFQNIGCLDLPFLGETPGTRAARDTNYRTPLFTNWDDAAGTTNSLGDISSLDGAGDVPPGTYNVDWLLPPNCSVWGIIKSTGAWDTNPVSVTATNGTAMTFLRDVAAKASALYSCICYDPAFSTTTGPSPQAVGITLGNSTGYPIVPTEAEWTTTYGNAVPTLSTPAGYPYVFMPTSTTAAPYAIYTRIIDPIQCPPFKFSTEVAFQSQGMWGVNNALVIGQLTNPGVARWLQGSLRGGMASLTYSDWQTIDAQLWLQFLTPPQTPHTLLPSRCVMEMMYKQYTQFNPLTAIKAGTAVDIPVPAYTFQCIPNYLVITVRPFESVAANVPFNECDYCLTFGDSPFTQFTFSNTSGLMSNMPKQQLVAMCRKNGVQASVSQYGGLDGSDSMTGTFMKSGQRIGAGGAPIVLVPGTDFPLPLGTAPGTSGMIQIQYTLRVKNQGLRDVNVQVLTQAFSTAYFINDNGAAKQQLVGLDEETLLSAQFGGADPPGVHQLIGGGAWDTIKHIGSKLWEHRNTIYNIARMGASAMGVPLPHIDLGGSGGVAGGSMGGQKRARQGGYDNNASLLAALAS